jgi:predicted RNase H-like nuclease (RuvC/YqgF family)
LAAAAAQHAQQLDELRAQLQQAEAAGQALQRQLEAEQDAFKLQLDTAAESMQQSVDSSRQLCSQLEESQAEVACLQGHLEHQERQLQVGRGPAVWLTGWWPRLQHASLPVHQNA